MQELPGQASWGHTVRGIRRITGDWMPDMGTMHANLVGSPRFEFRIEQGVSGQSLGNVEDGERGPSIRNHRHLRAMPEVTPNRRIHHPFLPRYATVYEGEVSLFRRAFPQLLRDELPRRVVLGDD